MLAEGRSNETASVARGQNRGESGEEPRWRPRWTARASAPSRTHCRHPAGRPRSEASARGRGNGLQRTGATLWNPAPSRWGLPTRGLPFARASAHEPSAFTGPAVTRKAPGAPEREQLIRPAVAAPRGSPHLRYTGEYGALGSGGAFRLEPCRAEIGGGAAGEGACAPQVGWKRRRTEAPLGPPRLWAELCRDRRNRLPGVQHRDGRPWACSPSDFWITLRRNTWR
ncbi:hypothetical protein NDU88_001433 [Pleurodeles waltl]|uniref:Uncharacterized protein n=1 Tax=Pleurodeles waltl TaxID=8319 RepID=A0AAV7L9P0_PLEWA|nr:hypothetical protein NDU88_001433 [Pleurodeles waltl]